MVSTIPDNRTKHFYSQLEQFLSNRIFQSGNRYFDSRGSALRSNSYSNRRIYWNCISDFLASWTRDHFDATVSQNYVSVGLGKVARSRRNSAINNDAIRGNISIRKLEKSRIARTKTIVLRHGIRIGGERTRKKKEKKRLDALLVLYDSRFLDVRRKFVPESTIKATPVESSLRFLWNFPEICHIVRVVLPLLLANRSFPWYIFRVQSRSIVYSSSCFSFVREYEI